MARLNAGHNGYHLGMEIDFAYIETTIPTGMTVRAYRAERPVKMTLKRRIMVFAILRSI